MNRRALNRALLARQMLLAREKATPVQVLERLVGMQAQQARPPFIGLWSRIEGFQREALRKPVAEGHVIRATLMRATLHLMTAGDYRAFRQPLQPVLTNSMQSALRDRARNLDVEAVVSAARKMFQDRPRTFTDLREELMNAFPDGDERAMGYAVRCRLPLASVPEDSPWCFPADSKFALAETDGAGTGIEMLVLRYLAAFGPASAADLQAWSGLQGVAKVLSALRPQLAVERDERKRELFDVPDAPRPDEATPAPVRFIAGFDNLILAHADRSRIIADEHRPRVVTKNLQVLPTILVDGFVAGTWEIEVKKRVAVVLAQPFGKLTKAVKSELSEEGEKLARFVEPEAQGIEVRF